MEQIYTIPVNEAFEECTESGACPFCLMCERLEASELDLILGASMMEPDIRIKTNEAGFCRHHFDAMLTHSGKKLALALMLESHIDEVRKSLKSPGLLAAADGAKSADAFVKVADSCYLCERIGHNFTVMTDCAAYLWETDDAFRAKLDKQHGFCLPHFAKYLGAAEKRMKKKDFAAFYKAIYKIEDAYLAHLGNDVSAFAKQFDYRSTNDSCEGAKGAPERAVTGLAGGVIQPKK